MDELVRARLAAYINAMEDTVCGEWHALEWPGCDDERYGREHTEGRALLALVGHEPVKPDYSGHLGFEALNRR